MRQKETEQELDRTGTGARQENFMFWARLRCRFGGDQRRDTGRQPTATPKMAFGTGSGVTLKSVTGSTGLQNEGLNMLRATWNPLKQCRLPMRLLCVPYFQETSGTHRFCGPDIFYDFGCILQKIGKPDEAKQMFTVFLRRVATETLDPVMQLTLNHRDVEEA